MDGAALRLGLVDRIALTWRDPRRAARAEIATADESRLLFYALGGSALYAMGAVGAEALAPSAAGGDWAAWVTTQAVVGLFFRPLALYGVAALIRMACRAAGGTGGWRETRAATLWTALAAEPAAVALTLAGAAATGVFGAPEAAADAGRSAGSLVWAALLAPALAEAHGFRSAWGVFAGFAALAAAAAALAAAA